MSFFGQLSSRIYEAMQVDQHRLRNQLRAIQTAEQAGKNFDKQLERLQTELEVSLKRRETRAASLPPLSYDDALPISAKVEEICDTIRNNQVVILCGETGSGKSTQLPKICLQAGRGITGLIGHTQPRRIAARSVSARITEELGNRKDLVGFKVRFTDTTAESTLIKVMTDGILLAETQQDRFLDQYDTLIIDEAHERSLNIDFLLGYLHRLLTRRPTLKLIITSATIDAERFAQHFAHRGVAAPILQVSGRTYPVEVRYRPLISEDEVDDRLGSSEGSAISAALRELFAEGPGDVLVFLPTERDIREVSHFLRGDILRRGLGNIELLPLYARLSAAEQNKVFAPHKSRRVVLSTNVAESSLTVPGIRYVIDTGTARISRYSARSKVQRLPIEAVAQASADQRKGRCGRVGPGICIRLYGEEDFAGRERFTPPEILRTNLASVILQTLAYDLGTLEEFPLLDVPKPEAIRDGYKTLFELGAIDQNHALTPLGRKLAKLPVDPRIGRMIVAAAEEHCLADMLIVAAALESQDIRDRPEEKKGTADEAHAKFSDSSSDFVSLIKIWDFTQKLRADLGKSAWRKALKQNFLSEMRLVEWQELHRQLVEMAEGVGYSVGKRQITFSEFLPPSEEERKGRVNTNAAWDSLHRSLLTGLLSNVACKLEGNEYLGAGNNKLFLWPGSGVASSRPSWIMGAELIETTKRYTRVVARIDSDWLEPLAKHLIHLSHSEPSWDRRGGQAIVNEKVSLFGLTIVPRRRVWFGPINPQEARQIFVRDGLALHELDSKAAFLKANREVLENIQGLASKARRRDWIVEQDALWRFYDQRVPQDVYDVRQLERWLSSKECPNPKILHMKPEDLLHVDSEEVQPTNYPDQLKIDRMELPLQYEFEPGSESDGITVVVPKEAVGQLHSGRLGWLVPGMLEAKVEALIRSLPKPLRRQLVPAPDVARQAVQLLPRSDRPFLPALAEVLSEIAGEPIKATDLDESKIAQHLRLNLRVIDAEGKSIAEGRDLADLQKEVGGLSPEKFTPSAADPRWHRDGIKSIDFGELPEVIEVRQQGLVVTRFPGLVDQGEAVGLRLFDSLADAEFATWRGLARLFQIQHARDIRLQVRNLPRFEQLKLWGHRSFEPRGLEATIMDHLSLRCLELQHGPVSLSRPLKVPRDSLSRDLVIRDGKRFLTAATSESAPVIVSLLEEIHNVRLVLSKLPKTWQATHRDIEGQLGELIRTGFLVETPWEWLRHYPRYLKGISLRIKRLTTGGAARDEQHQRTLGPLVTRLQAYLKDHGASVRFSEALSTYRWMLEELRVSLFAQEMGTSQAVSPQRLDKQWQKVTGGGR